VENAIQIIEEVAVDLSTVQPSVSDCGEGRSMVISEVCIQLIVKRLNKAAAMLRGENDDA